MKLNETTIVSGSYDNTLRIWDLTKNFNPVDVDNFDSVVENFNPVDVENFDSVVEKIVSGSESEDD